MKTIFRIAFITAMIFLLPSCEKISLDEYLKVNDITDPSSDTQKPAEDGEIAETGLVDLGLSVKWAACNLDNSEDCLADVCSDPGSPFQWSFDDMIYPPENISGTENDNATELLGDLWRTPTIDEMQELIDKCRISNGQYRGINGVIVTGPSGKAIFLPSGNYKGYWYWTGTYDLISGRAYYYKFTSYGNYIENRDIREYNYIRPVYGPLKSE